MSTLKVTNLQHPSAASANVTLDSSGNADFNGKNLAGVASVNGSQLGGFKNRIINGNFSIAQRGTSQTSAQYGSLDRWYFNTSGGTGTLSQETNANPSETGGLQKYARLNITSSSDFTAILQRIEDVTSIPSGTVVLSFYAKGTAPAGGLMVWCTQVFGSGGSADVDIAEQVITSSLTGTWTRYTLSITVPSIDGKTIGTGSYFMVTIGQGSDSSSTAYDLNISGVQLEVSSDGTATSFEHEDVGTTLSKCQRYYYALTDDGTTTNYMIGGVETSTAAGLGGLAFPTSMRAVPTATLLGTNVTKFYSGATGTDDSVSISANRCSSTIGSLYITGFTGGTVGQACSLYNGGSGSGISFDAEL